MEKVRVAEFISKVLNPYVHPLYLLPLLSARYHQPLHSTLLCILVLSGVPLTLHTLLRTLHLTDSDVSESPKRILILTVTLLTYLLLYLYLRSYTKILSYVMGTYTLVTAGVTLLTLLDRISIHVTSTVVPAYLLYVLGPRELSYLLYTLTPLVAWSRYVLRKHTLRQLVEGFLTAQLLSYLAYLLLW